MDKLGDEIETFFSNEKSRGFNRGNAAGARFCNQCGTALPSVRSALPFMPQEAASESRFQAQLVQRTFVLEELGVHELKGVAEPMRLYTVVGSLPGLLRPMGRSARLTRNSRCWPRRGRSSTRADSVTTMRSATASRGSCGGDKAAPDAAQAELCFQQALDVARQQEAKSWELRAALSLARLWQQQDKRAEARNVPLYCR
jgi:hypothetical protein